MASTEWWIVTVVAAALILLFVGLEYFYALSDGEGALGSADDEDAAPARSKLVS